MLEKLLNNLKQSLPEPIRKKLGIETEPVEDEEDSIEALKGSHYTPDNEVADSEAEAKKKKMSMIIRVVVVIALGFLAVDHFILSEDSQNEIVDIPVKPRKRRPKPVPPVAVAEVSASSTTPTATTPETSPVAENLEVKKETSSETIPEGTTPPVENINIADKKPEEVKPDEVKPEEIKPEEVKTEEAVTSAPKVGESKSGEQIDKSLDSLIDGVDAKESKDSKEKKEEVKLEDKIVADDVYTAPPTYDQLGRGLVYNCKDKFWVCVDKISYVACNKNMKWNKAHGKAAECVVNNVYASEEDCGVVQKHNVSTSTPTTFCK